MNLELIKKLSNKNISLKSENYHNIKELDGLLSELKKKKYNRLRDMPVKLSNIARNILPSGNEISVDVIKPNEDALILNKYCSDIIMILGSRDILELKPNQMANSMIDKLSSKNKDIMLAKDGISIYMSPGSYISSTTMNLAYNFGFSNKRIKKHNLNMRSGRPMVLKCNPNDRWILLFKQGDGLELNPTMESILEDF